MANDNNDNVIPLHEDGAGWAACPHCHETDFFAAILEVKGAAAPTIRSLICFSSVCQGGTSIDVAGGLEIIRLSDN